MKIYNLQIKNVNYKYGELRNYFNENYPNTIHLFLIGGWFKIYNKDAEIISDIFNYKMFEDNYAPYLGNVCCGFPKYCFSKIKDKLTELKINFILINTDDYNYSFYDFENENKYEEYYDSINDDIICSLFSLEENNNSELKVNTKYSYYKKPDTNNLDYSDLKLPEHKKFNNVKHSKKQEQKINYVKAPDMVQEGDTITIKKTKTNELETYTIIKTYKIPKPVGFTGERGSNFGKIKYKDELVEKSEPNKNRILSESGFAKKLLGRSLNDKVILSDDELNPCEYEIIKIIKN